MRHQIPLVSIVLYNSCLGAEKAQQQRFYGEKYIGVDMGNPRFDQLAEVFGAKGFYVEPPGEVADAVQRALALGGPSAIEIPVAEYFPRRHRFRAPKFHRPTRRIDSNGDAAGRVPWGS